MAGKIQRLGAGPVPEMVLWTGICEDWNVPVDLRAHCVWRAFEVTSGRERFRRDVAELQAQMPVVHDQVTRDGTEILDLEGRAMAAEVRERMQRLTGQWNKTVEQPIEAAEAELRELTGITDPAFYTRLFAITPRVTADQVSAEGELIGGQGTTP